MLRLYPNTTERPASAWAEVPVPKFAQSVLDLARGRHAERGWLGPAIVAIDGRSGAGKSTLARALCDISGGTVLSSDDLMWWEPMWQWSNLAVQGVLEPLHRGANVDFTPPKWTERGREGSIVIPNTAPLVIFEGNGSSQLAFFEYLAATVWVQSDVVVARDLGLARDIEEGANGSPEEAADFWDRWEASAQSFFEDDMPWARADFTVVGAADPMPRAGTVRVAGGTRRKPDASQA